jgi:hypothetical protein
LGIRLDWADEQLWLLLEPRTVIEGITQTNKAAATDFARERTVRRYNPTLNALLSFWSALFASPQRDILALGIGAGVDAAFRLGDTTAFLHVAPVECDSMAPSSVPGTQPTMARSEPHALCFYPERSQDGDCNRDNSSYQRERQGIIVAVVNRDVRLHGRIHRGDQIANLVGKAGKGAARVVGRQFVQMDRNDAPGALHHDLH